ncbi:hypothetical protein BASA61_001681 [Batrachochytrium salamandrivorans]|nr:hypothetical protein BASA61_001681 [Batrachochytrium salamandrivorans]KAJ1343293.1 hypothetical protein BSLG_002319 [Batrachochytrium salamandrivorans]
MASQIDAKRIRDTERPPQETSSMHRIFGYAILLVIVCQVALGACVRHYYNPDLSRSPFRDRLHGKLGTAVILASVANSALGMMTAVQIGASRKASEPYAIATVWSTFLAGIFMWLECTYGQSQRYVDGNVFVAAGTVGAKRLFSMPASERRRSLQTASIEALSPKRKSLDGTEQVIADTADPVASVKNAILRPKLPLMISIRESDSQASPHILSPIDTHPMWWPKDAGSARLQSNVHLSCDTIRDVSQHSPSSDSDAAKTSPSSPSIGDTVAVLKAAKLKTTALTKYPERPNALRKGRDRIYSQRKSISAPMPKPQSLPGNLGKRSPIIASLFRRFTSIVSGGVQTPNSVVENESTMPSSKQGD